MFLTQMCIVKVLAVASAAGFIQAVADLILVKRN